MGKHTNGPWVIGDENNQCCFVQLGSAHNLTCNLDRQDCDTGKLVISRDEMLANARLISAAPCMYEALQEMVATYERYLETGIPADAEESKRLHDKMKAALKKADGEMK